jgi:phage-related protein
MSCIGSNALVTAKIISGEASIDYVNVDLYEKGLKEVTTSLNKIMSYRIKAKEEFVMELSVQGMGSMKIKVKPSKYEAETEIV